MTEPFGLRQQHKFSYNEYHKDEKKGSDWILNQKALHDKRMEEDEQTWYFAIADCDGALELFKDPDTKTEHLLGLYDMMQDKQRERFGKSDENYAQGNQSHRMTYLGKPKQY